VRPICAAKTFCEQPSRLMADFRSCDSMPGICRRKIIDARAIFQLTWAQVSPTLPLPDDFTGQAIQPLAPGFKTGSA
jgi:hypothetical protein